MYYSQLQTQKSEQKMIQAEKTALKKLENIKLDHNKRLENLLKSQEDNKLKGNDKNIYIQNKNSKMIKFNAYYFLS